MKGDSMDEISRQEATAKRILSLFPFWEIEGTKEEPEKEIFNQISVDPLTVIEFLLDRIEEDEA